MLPSERITRPQIIVPCVTTAARGHACSLRAPLTCIGRIRHLGASVPWGAPSAGASSARCARLRRASWPPPPEGSKAVGDYLGGGLAHVPSTARGGRSGRPAGIGLTCALPWEQRAGQVQPGAELPGAPRSLRRCGGRARARPGLLRAVCTFDHAAVPPAAPRR